MTGVFRSHKMPRRLAVAAALLGAGLLAGCSGVGETNVHGIVITESMVSKVKPGTTQEAVIEALGTPSTTSTINGEAFYYVSQTSSRRVAFLQPSIVDRTVLVIYFNKTGKVERVAHYGLEDGVVFDKITRTTPTAGTDQSFITQLLRGMTMGVPGLGQ